MSSLLSGLTQADLETSNPTGNGTSNGVESDTEHEKVNFKEEEVKEEEAAQVITPRHVLTTFELEGLRNLLGKLEELPSHKKCVPAGIRNATALLDDMRAVLEAHANDNPKLAYTGEPIVKWPERPAWYQPPTPPPPVIYRPRLGPTLHKSHGQRSTKRSSISALRRRRVRCKRCAACCRKECGTCHYCHDMRKFGGPGRMKKSCIMRQCLAPALPNTARCAICGEGESDESNPSTHSLMECSVCSQIAHRQCIKVICLRHSEGYKLMHYPNIAWFVLLCTKMHFVGSEMGFKQSLDRSPRLLSSRVLSRLRSPTSRISQGRGRSSTWASGSSYHSAPGETGSFQQQQSSLSLVLESKGEPRRGRGRGVRLRGGGAGRGIRSGRSHGELEEEDEEEDEDTEDSSSSSSTNSSSSDEEEERGQNSGRGLDKENQPQSRRGGRAAKEREEEGSEVANQNGAEEDDVEEMEQDSQMGVKDGSYLKVTLQKPTRAKRDPSAIVPKLEAVAPQTATSAIHNQTRALVRPPIRNRGPCPDQHSNRHTPPHTRSGHTDTRTSHPERPEASKRTKPSRSAKLSNGASCSSTSELAHLRIPLSALQEGGSEADRENGGSGPGCEREVWVSVFRYLSRADLCVCMAVCKNWYKWCLDKRLWSRIDLSIKRTVTPQALTGIIKRQPVTLDLSWTNISKKQLNWLVGRLPGLKDLMLAGCSWSSISALCSSSCPLLRSLDLRYADGVKDSQIRDLVTPPGCDNRSQLRTMQCLRLAGLDISDSTLRLVIRHMPHLTKLDLSHCNSLTDHSINLLTAVGSSTRNTLTELNLTGCSKLTDTCLKYLRRLSCISLLDLRSCKGVTRKGCEDFISELSVNTLYCLSDEKLIQRIS
uniref:Lysine (K)-specific demethylase 2Ab n=1 Tax=Dicentrarchus labrax TaxID=13489 RepID=A0A8C4GU69_DICLA